VAGPSLGAAMNFSMTAVDAAMPVLGAVSRRGYARVSGHVTTVRQPGCEVPDPRVRDRMAPCCAPCAAAGSSVGCLDGRAHYSWGGVRPQHLSAGGGDVGIGRCRAFSVFDLGAAKRHGGSFERAAFAGLMDQARVRRLPTATLQKWLAGEDVSGSVFFGSERELRTMIRSALAEM